MLEGSLTAADRPKALFRRFVMDVKAREHLASLINDITKTGEWTLDNEKLKVGNLAALLYHCPLATERFLFCSIKGDQANMQKV